jgi:hypothetical protein
MFESEAWTPIKMDIEGLEAQQIKFLRPLVRASRKNPFYIYVDIGRNRYCKGY